MWAVPPHRQLLCTGEWATHIFSPRCSAQVGGLPLPCQAAKQKFSLMLLSCAAIALLC